MTSNLAQLITLGDNGQWQLETLAFGPWEKLKRMMGETFISDYREKMEFLRAADARVQAWARDLEGLVKESQIALKSNRLVDLAIVLKRINDRLIQIKKEGPAIEKVIEGFEEDHEFPLSPEVLKSAGFWSRLKRDWMAEKMESNKRKERKLALVSLVDFAGQTVASAMSELEKMEEAKKHGNIGKYLDGLEEISKIQFAFQHGSKENKQHGFQLVYKKYLQPAIDAALARHEKEMAEYQTQELPLAESPIVNPAPIKAPDPLPLAPPPSHSVDVDLQSLIPTDPVLDLKTPKQLVPNSEPPANSNRVPTPSEEALTEKLPLAEIEQAETERPPLTEIGPMTQRSSSSIHQALLKQANEKFMAGMASIEKMGDVHLMAAYLIKHSEKIEDWDLPASLKLLAVAEGLLDG